MLFLLPTKPELIQDHKKDRRPKGEYLMHFFKSSYSLCNRNFLRECLRKYLFLKENLGLKSKIISRTDTVLGIRSGSLHTVETESHWNLPSFTTTWRTSKNIKQWKTECIRITRKHWQNQEKTKPLESTHSPPTPQPHASFQQGTSVVIYLTFCPYASFCSGKKRATTTTLENCLRYANSVASNSTPRHVSWE